MIPKTTERVNRNTPRKVNQQIRSATEAHIAYYSAMGPQAIDRRLKELDREWDIERLLEANASTLAFLGVVLALRRKRWLWLPAAVTAFLFQHAVQGWCPPVPLLRRLGLRTATEIDHERYALKAVRGDFEKLPKSRKRAARPKQLEKILETVEQ